MEINDAGKKDLYTSKLPVQLSVVSVSRLLANISKIFISRFARESIPVRNIDRRLKQEIEDKKNAQVQSF